MKNLNFAFVLVILGSIIGAGFASGKEIAVFFSGIGILSYMNIILLFIFFYFLLQLFMKLGNFIKPKNLFEVNKFVFKRNYKLFNVLVLFGLFAIIVSMIAGINSIGEVVFNNIKFPVLSIFSVFFTFFMLNLGYKAISKLNKVLVPIIIFFIVLICLISIFKTDYLSAINNNFSIKDILKYFCFMLFYISFNVIYSSELIIENSHDFSKKQVKSNSFAISLMLVILVFIINYTLLHVNINTFYSDMPILNIAYSINTYLGYIFSLILWISILTTLISTLYIFINCFTKNKFLISAIILTLAFIFSSFGFSYIVNIIYPIEGIIGSFFIIFCLKFYIKNKKELN